MRLIGGRQTQALLPDALRALAESHWESDWLKDDEVVVP